MRLAVMGVCIVFLATGCAMGPELTPAPAANRVAGLEDAAIGEVAGVRTVVRADAWTGVPAALPELTPLQTSIENHSGRPLRIQYRQFALVALSGRRYAALPPYKIEGTAVTSGPIMAPAFPYREFSFAPYYNPTPLELPGWPGPFPYDPDYGTRYYGLWRAPLPTEDMLEKALPEGVLKAGGYLQAGFLYFEEVDEGLSRLDFTFDLVDATNGERFGTIRIPFSVREG
jgi:hypothetical protein